jgi:hypothetical protein
LTPSPWRQFAHAKEVLPVDTASSFSLSEEPNVGFLEIELDVNLQVLDMPGEVFVRRDGVKTKEAMFPAEGQSDMAEEVGKGKAREGGVCEAEASESAGAAVVERGGSRGLRRRGWVRLRLWWEGKEVCYPEKDFDWQREDGGRVGAGRGERVVWSGEHEGSRD